MPPQINNENAKFPYFLLLNSDGKLSYYHFIDIRENNERFLRSPIVCSNDGLNEFDEKENEKTQENPIPINGNNIKLVSNPINSSIMIGARCEGSKINNFGPSPQNHNISNFENN